MTANEYLSSVNRLNGMIKEKLDEVHMLKSKATSTTISYGKDRVQCSCQYDKNADIIAQIIDTDRDIDCLIDILVDTKRNIRYICKQMDSMQAVIIEKKYIEGKSLPKIAKEYGIKVGKVKYIHKKAVKSFEEIYLTTRYSV